MTKLKTMNSPYPELTNIANKIAKQAVDTINRESKKTLKSNIERFASYKAQFILEEVVRILEESI